MRLYDSVQRKKLEFTPLNDNKVNMYVCGPTVYDNIHIGNARTFLSFDLIRRYLEHAGYEVTFVQNVTDIDDKIINRAQEENRSSHEVAEEYTNAFISVMRSFGVQDPDIRCYATREIGPMIDMITRLIEKDHAYESNGDVYFSVRSYLKYGELSGRDIDDLQAGARVEANDRKKDPLDFALWKAAKPGEPYWASPWSDGRPGWHTECAAMVEKYLSAPIDIHGGGSDLSFPHHENESAQAGAAFDAPLSKHWMHTGMLTVDGEKMSKSLGNFYTLKEVLEQYDPTALRLLMVQTHYRSPLDFSFERLRGAEGSLARLNTTHRNLLWALEHNARAQSGQTEADKKLSSSLREAKDRFEQEMQDDFNSAGAIAQVFNLASAANTYLEASEQGGVDKALVQEVADALQSLLSILGIELEGAPQSELPAEVMQLAQEIAGQEFNDAQAAVDALLNARAKARAEKDWATADAIRDGLGELGLKIEDTAAGARVVRS